jgi:DNA-binding NtrC family response regulator
MATILLVDDDPLQASLMMSFLGRRFGEVLRVAGAAEALCLIEQPGFASKLGLVISAHHTPGIGGPTFVEELHTRMPNMPVLVLGAGSEVPADYSNEPVVFLPQPLVAEQMLASTARLLAAQGNIAEQRNVVA